MNVAYRRELDHNYLVLEQEEYQESYQVGMLLKNKVKWFTSFSKNEISYCYAGENYGFGFEITESELNFYNSKETDILERIKENFKVL